MGFHRRIWRRCLNHRCVCPHKLLSQHTSCPTHCCLIRKYPKYAIKFILLILMVGCFCNPLLRRHRRSSGATAIPHLWPFLQRTHWRYHGDDLPVQFARGPLPTTPVVGSSAGYRFRPCCHAPHKDDPSTCRSNSLDSLRRPSHLGPAMVLLAGPSAIIDDCSGDRLLGQQSAATIP